MYLCYVMSEHFDAAKTVLGRKLENKIIFNFFNKKCLTVKYETSTSYHNHLQIMYHSIIILSKRSTVSTHPQKNAVLYLFSVNRNKNSGWVCHRLLKKKMFLKELLLHWLGFHRGNKLRYDRLRQPQSVQLGPTGLPTNGSQATQRNEESFCLPKST